MYIPFSDGETQFCTTRLDVDCTTQFLSEGARIFGAFFFNRMLMKGVFFDTIPLVSSAYGRLAQLVRARH